MEPLKIVFYDGDCGLCNRSVSLIYKNDPDGIFHFMPLQSPRAERLLNEHGRSNAVIVILKNLTHSIFNLFATLLHLVPKKMRDIGYNFIAKNRHRFLKHTCALPPPEVNARFLEGELNGKISN